MGGSWSFPMMEYGNTWRIHRRLFHRFFNTSVADQFDDKICEAINGFLRRLSESPERFLKYADLYVGPRSTLVLSRAHHTGSLTGSLTLSVAYGLNVKSESDKFYAASKDAMDAVNVAVVPGNFLVDVLPIRMNFGQVMFVQTEEFSL